jgi:hypothetical protein
MVRNLVFGWLDSLRPGHDRFYVQEAMSAQGTIIRRSHDPNWPIGDPVGGPVDFTDIAELRDITLPALTRNALETTTHNELDDTYIVGIRRHGDMTFMCNFVPSNDTHDHETGLQFSWFEGLRDIYQVEFPDGTMWVFSGFVTNIGATANVDSILTADVTVRPTGRHDWVSA